MIAFSIANLDIILQSTKKYAKICYVLKHIHIFMTFYAIARCMREWQIKKASYTTAMSEAATHPI